MTTPIRYVHTHMMLAGVGLLVTDSLKRKIKGIEWAGLTGATTFKCLVTLVI